MPRRPRSAAARAAAGSLALRAGVVVAAIAVTTAALTAVGRLLTEVLDDPSGLDAGVTGWMIEQRTPGLDELSALLVDVSRGAAVVATTMLALGVLRSRLGRWREGGFLLLVLLMQAVVLAATHLLVERDPPAIGATAATAATSFPSDTAGTAAALCGALAVLVGGSEVYRGMHHATDVLAAFANAAVALWVGTYVTDAARWRRGGPVERDRLEESRRPTTAELRDRLRVER